MAANMKLKSFRGSLCLTQEQISEKIGISNRYYARVEQGVVHGNLNFWIALQETFGISNSEMWEIMKGEMNHAESCEGTHNGNGTC